MEQNGKPLRSEPEGCKRSGRRLRQSRRFPSTPCHALESVDVPSYVTGGRFEQATEGLRNAALDMTVPKQATAAAISATARLSVRTVFPSESEA